MSLARVPAFFWLWCLPSAVIKNEKEKHRQAALMMQLIKSGGAYVLSYFTFNVCVWMLTRLDTFSAANEDNKNICWRRGAVPWSLTKSFGLPLHRHTPNLSGQRVTRWNQKNQKKNKLLPPVCILGQFPVRWVDIWREAPLPAEILDQRWEGVSQGQWGWVRRHVQNWHSALPEWCPEWFLLALLWWK